MKPYRPCWLLHGECILHFDLACLQPLDEKELERKLKKDQKVLTVQSDYLCLHDVTGNLVELCGPWMPSFNQCCQTCSLTGEREGGEEDQSKTEGSSQAPGGCNGLMLNFM